jgi:hypothetical protein
MIDEHAAVRASRNDVLLLTGALVLVASGPAAGQLAQTPGRCSSTTCGTPDGARFSAPLPFRSAAPADVNVWQSFGMIASSPTIASDGTIYVGVDVPRPPTSARDISAPSSRT